MELKLIDISHWQNDKGTINWSDVKSNKVEAVIIKATQNTNYTDPYFTKNVTNASKAGLGVGAYHFAKYKTKSAAIKEANYFLSKIKGKNLTWGAWLDLEDNPGKLSKKDLTDASIEFIKVIKKSGFKVGIYINLNYYNNFVDYARIKKETGAFLWLARYRDKKSGAGVTCDIWQHTSTGKVDGINGNVDMNIAYTNIGKKETYIPPIPPPAVIDPIKITPIEQAPVEETPKPVKEEVIPVFPPSMGTPKPSIPVEEVKPEEPVYTAPPYTEELSVEIKPNFFENYGIDKTKKPKRIKIYLARPDRTIIDPLRDASNKNMKIKFNEVNELSFTIPIKIERRNKIIPNPTVEKLRGRTLVKAIYGGKEEWFVVRKKTRSSSDTDTIQIQCYSLAYELKSVGKMIGYSVISYNAQRVMSDCLKGTSWKIGYINPEFNLKYRKFDISSTSKLDFLYEIAKTFEGIITFDTVNKLVHLWKIDEISLLKGFTAKYGQYIQSIEDVIDENEIVTRLIIKGSDDLRINTVNPTGEMFLDDFSYFMYPFELDETGNVVQSSYSMSDDLCIALYRYKLKVEGSSTSLSDFLKQKKAKQEQQTEEENKLSVLNTELKIILDDIKVAKQEKVNYDNLVSQRDDKKDQISMQKGYIDTIKKDIANIDKLIVELKSDLKLENNLSDKLADELQSYIHLDDWSDDNIIDENDLYEAGYKQLRKVSQPPVNISMDIVNFMEMVSEQKNWNRLNIGDIIKIEHPPLGIYIEARVTGINIDDESGSISIEISDSEKVRTVQDRMAEKFYTASKVNTDYNARKPDFIRTVVNYNARNDRIKEVPADPSFNNDGSDISHVLNDNGTANITVAWKYNDYNVTKVNSDNIDGFYVYMYADDTAEKYEFGSTMANENKVMVGDFNTRSYTFMGIPANKHYTFGVRAYRVVDEDIDSNGYLLSEIISPTDENSSPYQPVEQIEINGKINGVTYVTGDVEPETDGQVVWTDTSGATPVTKFRKDTTETWSVPDSNATSVGNYAPDVNNTPNTIPTRDMYGVINGNISGSASSVQGKIPEVENGLATLDVNGKVPSAQLSNASRFAFGEYTGNGASEKTVTIGFTPNLVKVHTTDSADTSLFIPSTLGGFSMLNYLKGNGNSPSTTYGSIITNGFKTGQGSDANGNKSGTKYYWEAYKVPSN